MKTIIEFTYNSQYNDYKVGDTGYIDGYVRGKDGAPYSVIVLNNGNITFAPMHHIKVKK